MPTIIEFTLDPTAMFHSSPNGAVQEACGLLPAFILDPMYETIGEALVNNYVFFTGWRVDNAKVSPEGVYTYPEDEPLYPLAKFQQGKSLMYIYEYGIVAMVEYGIVKWTRCD